MSRVLVTGGAGFIGSHLVAGQLAAHLLGVLLPAARQVVERSPDAPLQDLQAARSKGSSARV